jgi:hypothetical protein
MPKNYVQKVGKIRDINRICLVSVSMRGHHAVHETLSFDDVLRPQPCGPIVKVLQATMVSTLPTSISFRSVVSIKNELVYRLN